MNAHVDSGSSIGSRDGRYLPAYGPVDAALGYALFYVVVDYATPTVVEAFAEGPGVPPSLVRLGLAAFLWFVLGATVLDQARRQLAALGVVGDADATDGSLWSPTVPSETQALAYVVLLSLGGLVAVWTFESALGTVVSLIRLVATLDPGAFVLGEVLVMAAFFVSFEVATYALDRLLVGGFRAMLSAEWDGPGLE